MKQFVLRLILCLSTLGVLDNSELSAMEENGPVLDVVLAVSRAQVLVARNNFGRVYDFFNFNVAGAPINIFGMHADVIPLAAIRPRVLVVRNFFNDLANNLAVQLIAPVAVPAALGLVNIHFDPALLNQAVGAANNILQTIDNLIAINLLDADILEHDDLLDIVWDDNSLLHRIDHIFEVIMPQLHGH